MVVGNSSCLSFLPYKIPILSMLLWMVFIPESYLRDEREGNLGLVSRVFRDLC